MNATFNPVRDEYDSFDRILDKPLKTARDILRTLDRFVYVPEDFQQFAADVWDMYEVERRTLYGFKNCPRLS